jgi:hypothetical protein
MLELEMVSAHGCMGVFFFQNSILDEWGLGLIIFFNKS